MMRPITIAALALASLGVAVGAAVLRAPASEAEAVPAADVAEIVSPTTGPATTTAPATSSELRPAIDRAPPVSMVAEANTQISSFSKAKRLLRGVYADHRITLYCGCTYDEDHQVDHASCGYVPVRDDARAHRVEWEHVVPAEAFGQSFVEWREGHPECVDARGKAFKGRNCARKASEAFRLMEADMYNLVPAIGEVNGRRSNYSLAMIDGEAREFGACDVEIADGKIEPRPEVRGDIARTYLYMDRAYPGRGVISRKNRKLFEAWAEEDPVNAWECRRARWIAEVQGSINAMVENACASAGL